MFQSKGNNIHWGDLNMADLELDKLILQFELLNKAECKSPKTVTWYTEMISGFTKFLTGTGRREVQASDSPTSELGKPAPIFSRRLESVKPNDYPSIRPLATRYS